MFEHFTGGKPKKVAVIGCGPSMQDYVNIKAGSQAANFHVDEVWGVNLSGSVIQTNLDFVMDDHAKSISSSPEYAYFERNNGKPLVTSAPRPQCPNAVAFPLAEALAIPGAREYFNHTIAYIIAYSIIIGVEELCVFGADYISHMKPYGAPGTDFTEPSRYMACTAYWCGIAASQGVNVIVTPNSPLLDADRARTTGFYGYLIPPSVKYEGE